MDLRNPTWRKASGSKEDGSNCVELAINSGVVAVRDSKNPDGPRLFLGLSDFRSLANALKNL
ncbi:DUF397 domain-containing protein [Actinomadura chibensis]|uniref:DUF397 domain-containing protein n=1 Tax=Actinomadura chibensis TaxID=392828 RepID=A0A5D0NV53_9ACTN|nr:DUF397 domain-containing protein [Actinomadura chibensis]TYB48068.1 DUF397 domain-containing protein [Actinomadura chibensis]